MMEGRRYKILGTLGRGGFGTVYRAILLGESGFTRPVALKVLNPDVQDVDGVAGRLRDEARLMGMLLHRAIVKVDALVRLDDRWTVVMEYVDGADLGKITADSPVPAGCALEIVGEVAGALHAAYNQPGPSGEPLKLLHRDIKPQNVVVTPHGEVKVLDFGVARADFEGREARTKAVLFGSLGYMAPERFEGEEGPSGDVFSLGVMFYEMLTGSTFGRASVHPQKFAQRRQEVLAELDQAPVPPAVVQFLARMIEYEPKARPTARDVERECRDLRVDTRGEWLRDWSEDVVPPLVKRIDQLDPHDFKTDIITETISGASAGLPAALEGGWPEAFSPSVPDATGPAGSRPPPVPPPDGPRPPPDGHRVATTTPPDDGFAGLSVGARTLSPDELDPETPPERRAPPTTPPPLPEPLPPPVPVESAPTDLPVPVSRAEPVSRAGPTEDLEEPRGPSVTWVVVQVFTILGVPALIVAVAWVLMVGFTCCGVVVTGG